MTHYPMRRTDREAPEDAAREILERASYCVVSMVDEGGEPYGVPISFALVGNTVYLHSANEGGRKLEAFARGGRVSLCAVCDVEAFFADGAFSTTYSSAIATGAVREVAPGVEFRQALVALCMKYVPEAKREIGAAMERELANTAVWAVDIDELSGKVRRGPVA